MDTARTAWIQTRAQVTTQTCAPRAPARPAGVAALRERQTRRTPSPGSEAAQKTPTSSDLRANTTSNAGRATISARRRRHMDADQRQRAEVWAGCGHGPKTISRARGCPRINRGLRRRVSRLRARSRHRTARRQSATASDPRHASVTLSARSRASAACGAPARRRAARVESSVAPLRLDTAIA